MGNVTINGVSGVYAQPAERGQDSSGPYRVLRFEGTRAAMKAKEFTLGLANYVYRESFSGGKDSIEVRFAGGPADGNVEAPQIVWEIKYSPVEKDILRSIAARTKLVSQERDQLRRYLGGEDVSFSSYQGLYAGSNLEQFVEVIKAGETAIRQFAPTLTRTITMATPLVAFIATQNLGRILRTASLFGSEGLLPTDFVFPLPNDGDPAPTADAPAKLHYGWQKMGLSGTRTAYQKTAIVQEYEYGLWPEISYELPL